MSFYFKVFVTRAKRLNEVNLRFLLAFLLNQQIEIGFGLVCSEMQSIQRS